MNTDIQFYSRETGGRAKMRRGLLCGALGLAGVVGLGLSAQAAPVGPAKADAALSQRMAGHPHTGWTDAIVNIGGAITPSQEVQLRLLGAGITQRLPIIGSVAVHLPSRHLAALAALPFVSHLSYDGQVKKSDDFTLASSGAGAAFAQNGLDGTGVTVAVVDSGIRVGQDMTIKNGTATRVLADVCVLPGDYNPDDLCGHGTHVAGIVAGNGAQSTGSQYTHTFYGVARNANIVGVRVLDSHGSGSVSGTLAGIQWVVSNRAYYKIKVLNLSLGHPIGESYKTDPLCQAVEAAWKAGIVVVCSAGNNGRLKTTQTSGAANEGWGTAYGTIQSPGNDPYVITVGATKFVDGTRAHDKIATYSSRGPSRLDLVCKPDILAAGNRVISVNSYGSTLFNYNNSNAAALPASYYIKNGWSGPSSQYMQLSGTSMAAPVVAGAAALLLQKYPTLSPDTVKARLMASADKWAGPDGTPDICTYGAGYLNIPAALSSSLLIPSGAYALSPQLIRNPDNTLSVNTDSLVAGNHVIWGTVANLNTIWGANIITGSHVIWGTSAPSASSVWSDHVIWGTTSSAVDLSSVTLNGE